MTKIFFFIILLTLTACETKTTMRPVPYNNLNNYYTATELSKYKDAYIRSLLPLKNDLNSFITAKEFATIGRSETGICFYPEPEKVTWTQDSLPWPLKHPLATEKAPLPEWSFRLTKKPKSLLDKLIDIEINKALGIDREEERELHPINYGKPKGYTYIISYPYKIRSFVKGCYGKESRIKLRPVNDEWHVYIEEPAP